MTARTYDAWKADDGYEGDVDRELEPEVCAQCGEPFVIVCTECGSKLNEEAA